MPDGPRRPGSDPDRARPARLPDEVLVADRPELVIRLWQVADAAELVEVVTASVEHLRPWMPWVEQEPMPVQEREARLATGVAEWERGEDAFYGIWLDGRAVGAIGAHRRIGPDGLEIGYWLRPDAVGHGLVTAAVRALGEALLALPGITHLEIRNDRANLASAAVPPRCGYRLVGVEARTIDAPAESGWGQVWRIGADPAPDVSSADVRRAAGSP
jgi:RimJ/RimL family protein N-acetyltransferase